MFQQKTIKALKWIVEILNRKNISYEISGGFAAKLYGSTRNLNDIDFDIPEENFMDILKEVRPYVIAGPEDINDGKWDMKIMTLNFCGQEIDIGGAYKARMSNKERTKWINIPADFSRNKKIEVEGLILNVISPEELIEYKKELDGEHQKEDVKAIEKYLKNFPN
jgi:hypothetical protein